MFHWDGFVWTLPGHGVLWVTLSMFLWWSNNSPRIQLRSLKK